MQIEDMGVKAFMSFFDSKIHEVIHVIDIEGAGLDKNPKKQ